MAVLPYGRSGVVAVSMLGMGRALRETVAVLIISRSPAPEIGRCSTVVTPLLPRSPAQHPNSAHRCRPAPRLPRDLRSVF